MIGRAVNPVSLAFQFTSQAAEICEQSGLDFRNNERFAILCAEDQMRQKICKGSAHYVAPPGGSRLVGGIVYPQLALWATDTSLASRPG